MSDIELTSEQLAEAAQRLRGLFYCPLGWFVF